MAAFESLVRAHQEVAIRTAWFISGGADDAEDAAQEGFVKAFAALWTLQTRQHTFRPWLLTIVANEARNRRRSAGRREALALRLSEDRRPDGAAPSPESAVLAEERRAALLGSTCQAGRGRSAGHLASATSWSSPRRRPQRVLDIPARDSPDLSRSLDRLRDRAQVPWRPREPGHDGASVPVDAGELESALHDLSGAIAWPATSDLSAR